MGRKFSANVNSGKMLRLLDQRGRDFSTLFYGHETIVKHFIFKCIILLSGWFFTRTVLRTIWWRCLEIQRFEGLCKLFYEFLIAILFAVVGTTILINRNRKHFFGYKVIKNVVKRFLGVDFCEINRKLLNFKLQK